MRKTLHTPAVFISLLLAGCVSGPRPYDGVIGYRAQATTEGFDISYVDEADVAPEKVLRKLQAVCAAKLQAEPVAVVVAVTGVEQFRQDVAMSVAVPVGLQGNGGSSGSGPALAETKSVVMQNEGVMRVMELRRTTASCRRVAAN